MNLFIFKIYFCILFWRGKGEGMGRGWRENQESKTGKKDSNLEKFLEKAKQKEGHILN